MLETITKNTIPEEIDYSGDIFDIIDQETERDDILKELRQEYKDRMIFGNETINDIKFDMLARFPKYEYSIRRIN